MPSDIAAKILKIRADIEALDVQRAVLQLELDEIIVATGAAPERRRGRPRSKSKRPIRPGSTIHWAYEVLRKRGRPWYIDDLVKDIKTISGMTVNKPSLVSSLSRYIKAGDTFTRPREGFYGLVDHSQPQDHAAVSASEETVA